MLDFLSLPYRPEKPRHTGITHVIDRGIGPRALDDMLSTSVEFIDIVKLGWGTGYVTANLKDKVATYQAAGIPVCFGGTLTEAVIAQGQLNAFRRTLERLNIQHVEISTGVLELSLKEKTDYIRELSRDFVVLSEVGSKDTEVVVAPYRWLNEIEAELEAGAWKVIAEARETGTVGLYRKNGEVRSGLVEEIITRVDPSHMIFEAPQKQQQVWFIKQFGPNVNLGNIAPGDVIPLETLRLGLRGDTLRDFHLEQQLSEERVQSIPGALLD
jgi:phosphosulfolactate synthase